MVTNKPLTPKGKKALNTLIKQMGKAKGRKIFYSLERNKPDWTKNWRIDEPCH